MARTISRDFHLIAGALILLLLLGAVEVSFLLRMSTESNDLSAQADKVYREAADLQVMFLELAAGVNEPAGDREDADGRDQADRLLSAAESLALPAPSGFSSLLGQSRAALHESLTSYAESVKPLRERQESLRRAHSAMEAAREALAEDAASGGRDGIETLRELSQSQVAYFQSAGRSETQALYLALDRVEGMIPRFPPAKAETMREHLNTYYAQLGSERSLRQGLDALLERRTSAGRTAEKLFAKIKDTAAQVDVEHHYVTNRPLNLFMMLTAASLCLGLLLLRLVLRRLGREIIQPIQAMADMTERIKAGDSRVRFSSHAKGELAELGQRLNEMLSTIETNKSRLMSYQREMEEKVAELAASEAELKRHKAQLSELVEERTANLNQVVSRLEEEILQRRQIERELREAMDRAEAQYLRLYAIISDMDEGIIFADKNGLIVEVNDYYCRFLHKERADILNGPLECAGLDSGESQISSIIELFKSGEARRSVTVNQHMFDCDVSLRLQPLLRNGQYEGVLLNLIDVTPLVEARRSAEREKAFLEKVLAIAGAAIYTVDGEGRITSVNDEFTIITGYGRDEALGRNRSFFLDAEAAPPKLASAPGQAEPRSKVECAIITKDGRHLTVLKNSDVLLDSYDCPESIIESFVDVTALSNAKLKAEETSRLKGEFLANMSHEIRTPMNGLLGLVQILEKTSLTPDQAQYLFLIKTSAESLLVILNDILDFSKIEAGRLEIRPAPINLQELIREMGELIRRPAEQKGIEVRVELPEDLPVMVETDGVRLRQILMNLLSNAVKFTAKGSIAIRARRESDESRPDMARIRFEVADTGIGIPEDLKEKIFLAFVQGDGSIAREYGGTGLGLSISNKLVSLMGGGQMEVEGRQDGGSRFSFMLPLKLSSSAVPAAPAQAGDAYAGLGLPLPSQLLHPASSSQPDSAEGTGSLYGRLRVLVAEDNALNQFLLRKILDGFGVRDLHFAANGQEAVEMVEAAPEGFDLILMDVQMPLFDGLSATRSIRDMGIGTPIVALTAHAMDKDKESCIAAGMDYYLAKPYRIDALQEVFDKILAGVAE